MAGHDAFDMNRKEESNVMAGELSASMMCVNFLDLRKCIAHEYKIDTTPWQYKKDVV